MDYKYREFAVDILFEINNKDGYSNVLLNEYMDKINNIQERNLLNITVNGVLENKIYLDWIIKELSNTKFQKISKKILEILRIGIYQIEFLDNINPKIVVYESVEEAKKNKNKYLSKFVNGILRSFIRQRLELKKSMERLENNKYLSIKYSFPISFIEKIQKEFDIKEIKSILESLNKRPDFTIRSNSTLIERDEIIKIFKEKGIESKKTKYSVKGINIINSDFLSLKNLGKRSIKPGIRRCISNLFKYEVDETIL